MFQLPRYDVMHVVELSIRSLLETFFEWKCFQEFNVRVFRSPFQGKSYIYHLYVCTYMCTLEKLIQTIDAFVSMYSYFHIISTNRDLYHRRYFSNCFTISMIDELNSENMYCWFKHANLKCILWLDNSR